MRHPVSVGSGRLSMTPSMTVVSSGLQFDISVLGRSGNRYGFSDRFAVQNNSNEMVRRKGIRLVMNIVQRAARRSGKQMKVGTNQPVSVAVVRPAIIETRGKRNGLSITRCPFYSPEISK